MRWIESSGALVLPILLNQEDDYYERIFHKTNGLFLPGGDNSLNPSLKTPMLEAAKILFKLAIDANDNGNYYPIWGTCLGFELLSVLIDGKNILSSCENHGYSRSVRGIDRGFLFSQDTKIFPFSGDLSFDYSGEIYNIIQANNLTYFYHRKCLDDKTDEYRTSKTSKFFKTLAYAKDQSGNEFIAIAEGHKYPFFGVQFHPEKPPFELISRHGRRIRHSRLSIEVSRYFADFFVTMVKKNQHERKVEEIKELLIYNYEQIYTIKDKNDSFTQHYLFPFKSHPGHSEIEFDN